MDSHQWLTFSLLLLFVLILNVKLRFPLFILHILIQLLEIRSKRTPVFLSSYQIRFVIELGVSNHRSNFHTYINSCQLIDKYLPLDSVPIWTPNHLIWTLWLVELDATKNRKLFIRCNFLILFKGTCLELTDARINGILPQHPAAAPPLFRGGSWPGFQRFFPRCRGSAGGPTQPRWTPRLQRNNTSSTATYIDSNNTCIVKKMFHFTNSKKSFQQHYR